VDDSTKAQRCVKSRFNFGRLLSSFTPIASGWATETDTQPELALLRLNNHEKDETREKKKKEMLSRISFISWLAEDEHRNIGRW